MANNDATQEPKQPPRHARMLGYAVEPAEKLLLLAIDEHCDGNTLTASKERLAAYTGLDIKTVRRIFNGHLPVGEGKGTQEQREARTQAARAAWRAGKRSGDAGKYKPGFIDRKILIQRGVGGWKRGMNVTSTYQLNEDALKECPKVKSYREEDRQRVLPGFREPAAPGHPIYLDKGAISPSNRGTVTMTGGRVTMTPHPPPQPEMRLALHGHHDRGYGHHDPASSNSAPRGTVTMTPPTVTMTGGTVTMTDNPINPEERIDLISLKDSSVLKDSVNPSTSSGFTVPVELKKQLREIMAANELPTLDDNACKQIWFGCKDHAPDLSVDEVVHFVWEKIPFLVSSSVRNPAGVLIVGVPQCFEGGESSALAHYREEEAKRQKRLQAKAEVLEAEEQQQRAYQEWTRQQQEESLRALDELEKTAPEEYQALLELTLERPMVEALIQGQRGKMSEAEIEQEVRRHMAMLMRNGELAKLKGKAAAQRDRADRQQREQEEQQRALAALEQMPDAEREALRAEAEQDPELAAYLVQVRKLIKQGFASDATAEPQIREKMLELLRAKLAAQDKLPP